jgi:hypothetical protein
MPLAPPVTTARNPSSRKGADIERQHNRTPVRMPLCKAVASF